MTSTQLVRRARIIEEVIDSIADVGAEAVQMRDVAQRSGVALATVYRYFSSKDHLLAAALEDWQKRLTRRIVAGAGPRDQDHLPAILEYLRREKDLLLDGVGVPHIHTSMEGKHVLIVVRGYDYREDLVALKSYIREYRPVLIGVDGGADALVENGYAPDLILGDMDSVKDETLRSGAEVVVHAYRDGRAPGSERLERLGIESIEFPATGTSEDIAMLLADSKGASLIVAVGTHNSLVEFLDKGRPGMASTFITRLRVGAKLVDAKGVSRLYRSRVSTLQVVALMVAGLFAVGMAMVAIGADDVAWSILRARWSDFVYWIRELFT